MLVPTSWLQFEVAPVRGEGAERAVLSSVAPVLARTPWFFTRWRHELRLRVAEDDAREALREALVRASEAGHLRYWSSSVFEPRTHAFGGPEGMALALQHFAADSRVWLELRLSPGAVPWTSFSAQCLRMLVEHGLSSAEEAWEVWAHLAVMRSLPLERESCRLEPDGADDWGSHARHLLAAHLDVQREVAERVLVLERSSQLLCGRRGWLANLAQQHFA